MKIGILTYHRAKNYGAFLQSYALCSRLNMYDNINAEIIDFQMDKEIQVYKLNSSLKHKIAHYKEYKFMHELYYSFDRALQYLKLSSAYYHTDEISEFDKMLNNQYDVIIAGSDEIWKVNGIRGFPTPYWLPGDLKCKKVSYAAASCTDFTSLDCKTNETAKNLLNQFSIISVRDRLSYNQIIQLVDKSKKVIMSPDPSFIYSWKFDRKNGKKILDDNRKHKRKKIAVVMTENVSIADDIRRLASKEYDLVSVFHWHKGYINIGALNPFEWIDIISAADFVFTSYFHAVCFSIITNVPFMAFGTDIKSNKLKDILYKSKGSSRYFKVSSNNRIDHKTFLNQYECCKLQPNCKSFLESCNKDFSKFIELLFDLSFD